MIEARRGGGRTALPAAPVAPPPPPRQPPRAPERDTAWRSGADLRSTSPLASPSPLAGAAGPASAVAAATDGGPVQLAGAKVPIGPGPRAGEVRGAAAAHPAAATGWVRPPAGVNGSAPATGSAATAPVPAPVPPRTARRRSRTAGGPGGSACPTTCGAPPSSPATCCT